ncbi:uncharacterized protein LOC117941526 [Etheostoma cragini]|uniref:uncharacterized protein LOC117941526 n=1 Tax=Etheostoma cragini TaxID=417921 RepID=UPI00155E2684|nr:uncharacterized protein LOC117941526 [Etheostoma cragini]
MTTVDLFNTLEDLKEEEFVKFKWHLHQDLLEGYQSIKVSKLENAERQDTVDVMVNTYRVDGALTVTKKVLEMMNRNDLVQSLPDTSSGPQVLAAASNVPEGEQSAQRKASSSSSEPQVSKPGDVPCDVCTGTKLKAELRKTDAEIQQMIQMRRLKIQEIKHSVELSEEDADREIAEGVQVFTSLKESVERGLNELINTIKEKQKTTEKQAEAYITELEQEISELMKRSTEMEQMLRSEDHLHLLQSVQSLNTNHPPPTKNWTEVSVRPSSYDGTLVKSGVQLDKSFGKQMKKLFAVSELMKRSTEVEQLSRSKDRPNLLQRAQSLNIQQLPPTKDWTEVIVRPSSYEGTVVKAVVKVEKTLSKQIKKLLKSDMKCVQQYAVDVTLDPDTARPELTQSFSL